MVGRFLFDDRDGRTPLAEDFKKDLIPRYIKLAAELNEVEENNIVDGLIWLDSYQGECADALFWKKAHKKMFDQVWKWAGQFRTHELDNEDFDHPGYIQEHIKRLEGDLKGWLSKANSMPPNECMARFHERFLTIHPFANGNGRTARILTEHICKRSGFTSPTWGHSLRGDPKAHRKAYVAALERARREHEFDQLIEFMLA